MEFTPARIKSAIQIIVLQSCRIRYVKGWSQLPAKRMISAAARTEQMMLRMTNRTLFWQNSVSERFGERQL